MRALFCLYICSALYCPALKAQTLSGLEFRGEFGSTYTDFNHERELLSDLIPEQGLAYFQRGYSSYYYNQSYSGFGVDLILGAKNLQLGRRSFTREMRLGLGLMIGSKASSELNYEQKFTDSAVTNYVTYQCKHHREQISFNYLLSGPVFWKSFKYYGGLGAALSLNYWGSSTSGDGDYYIVSRMARYKDSMKYSSLYSSELGSSTDVSFNALALAGLKYNLSCDINLFVEYRYSMILHSKYKHYIQQGSAISLGFRYKFLNEEEKSKNGGAFW